MGQKCFGKNWETVCVFKGVTVNGPGKNGKRFRGEQRVDFPAGNIGKGKRIGLKLGVFPGKNRETTSKEKMRN